MYKLFFLLLTPVYFFFFLNKADKIYNTKIFNTKCNINKIVKYFLDFLKITFYFNVAL